jgi:hypothetical protein
MFISVYASGTNVQRLSKCSKKIDGVLYTAYSQMEKEEPGMVRRKFYCTEVASLKEQVEALSEQVQPSWQKIWGKPLANEAFVGQLLQSLTGQDTLRIELNLSALAEERVDCFMLLVSANKKEMADLAKIAGRHIPDWHVKVLNGDFTNNKDAQYETTQEINEARIAGKKGVLIIANQMGSRSYSIPEIQATVIAFDRGSVDATAQKVSRCLTPTKKDRKLYDGVSDKEYGIIFDLSFDPNRAENIERLILEEAVQIQRDGTNADDFASAVKYVLSSINLFKMKYGTAVEMTEEEMFKVFSDNEAMLRVADISVDIAGAIDSGMFNILANVNAEGKSSKEKKSILGENAINAIREGGSINERNSSKDPAIKNAEQIINNAIRALNMSATSVYYLAQGGESYRECLELVNDNDNLDNEFTDLFGVSTDKVITLLDNNVLNEAILDVIVQNSKPKLVDNLFN